MSRTNVDIHQTAIVHPEAKLAEGCKIGPYCIIGPQVELGESNILHSHVVMEGVVKTQKNNSFFSFCSIGAPPQDLTYQGEPTVVQIGEGNTFREYVSIHRGTKKQDEITIVGNNSLFMAYVHLGHDVCVGNNVIVANSTNFAGHVTVGNGVIIGGGTQISQFVTLGEGAYIGGASAIDRDIPHFCTAYGNRVKLKGINIIGLRRRGYSKTEVSEVVDFYRNMEASKLSPRAFIEHDEFMDDYKNNKVVQDLCAFIRKSEIGIAPFIS